MLNLKWDSVLNDEYFLGHRILDHIWNSLSAFPFNRLFDDKKVPSPSLTATFGFSMGSADCN